MVSAAGKTDAERSAFGAARRERFRWDKQAGEEARYDAALPPVKGDDLREMVYRLTAVAYSTRRKVTWIVAGVWVMAGIATFGFVVSLWAGVWTGLSELRQ